MRQNRKLVHAQNGSFSNRHLTIILKQMQVSGIEK